MAFAGGHVAEAALNLVHVGLILSCIIRAIGSDRATDCTHGDFHTVALPYRLAWVVLTQTGAGVGIGSSLVWAQYQGPGGL